MTFSFNVKDEVTRLDTSKIESISELSAIIRNSSDVNDINDNIVIHIENSSVARRIYKLIKSLSLLPSEINNLSNSLIK